MILIPAGEFIRGSDKVDLEHQAGEMGSAKPWYLDEHPQHKFYLPLFYIDRYEVTNAQYKRFIDAVRARPPVYFYIRSVPPGRDHLPVTDVNWYDADRYCRWIGKRLPTEAEWEKAARGPNGWLYPWGNEFDGRRLNYCDKNCSADWHGTTDDTFARTGQVGVFATGASPYDVLDMAGNAREWVHDFYDFRGYFRVPTANPPGLESGLTHVIRGGSWLDSAERVRAAARAYARPDIRDNLTGFRCAVSELP